MSTHPIGEGKVVLDASITDKNTGTDSERNSALAIGMLHFFVVFAFPALLWNSEFVERDAVLLWASGEALLGLLSFGACWALSSGRVQAFLRLSRLEGVGTAGTFAALAWLGDDVATATPSKHVLMMALVAVTSISAANSSHITRHRSFFNQLIVILAISYVCAFLWHGEWTFAVLALLWCISIFTLTHVGYKGMLELIELRNESEQTARHDDLTGLLSRSAFFEALDKAAGHAKPERRRQGTKAALVLFDLDGFKAINDSFGHAAGDEVLRTAAKRLALFLPEGSVIARLGGDEFAAIVIGPPEALKSSIGASLNAVADPIGIDGRELYVAASAGWTFIEPNGESAELMAQADAAMYQSKNSGTDASTGFDADLRDELDRALEVRQEFRTALRRNEIEFWAQPLVRTSDGIPVAVELLARWPQDGKYEIGPAEFTRVAEETGLAVELDCQALAAARTMLVKWFNDPVLGGIIVKANISPMHLHNGELIESVQEHIPALLRHRLGLEFVETRLIQAAERNHAQLRTLLDMGVTLSIDDFGVGYSSLTYLRSLPVSEIKIDRSFVTDVDSDDINQGLIRAIVDIAATLGLPTVAEGIETEAELAEIARLGVHLGQGYLLGRPIPIAEITEAVRGIYQSAIAAPR